MKKYGLYYLFIVFFNFHLNAEQPAPRYLIMGVPQYLLLNGIRIDLDYRIKNTQTWIVFSPQFYNYKSSIGEDLFNLSNDYLKLTGSGMYVLLKKMLYQGKADGIYLAGGGGYNYYSLKAKGRIWEEIEPNIYMPFDSEYDVNIHKIGLNALMGAQFIFYDVLYVDFYVGFGLRHSFRNIPINSYNYFNKSTSDFGYRGTLFIGGFRVGLPIY